MKRIRVGAGSGFGGDRIEPAVELAAHGKLDYLVFECLAERTIALAQQARMKDPEAGYDRLLAERMTAIIPYCRDHNIKIVSNMGAANPRAAARMTAEIARQLGAGGLKIACVMGDDVTAAILEAGFELTDRRDPPADIAARVISANAYLGVEPIVQALAQGADIVITGRVGDPALFLAPMVHEFGWALDDWDRLGKGTAIGHLLECAGHLTGGYFADPGYKDVRGLARLGFPLAEITEDGDAVFTKVDGSGGEITLRTCTEQLLYEVHDPAAYLQPDVIADFTTIRFAQEGPDQVRMIGGTGHPKTGTLKVTVGYRDGFIGEGQISYAGSGAASRARLALDIVTERLQLTGVETSELRCDIIGIDGALRGGASHGSSASQPGPEPRDVRARICGRTATLRDAERIGREIEAVWINGPAGGGGATWSAREVIAAGSMLLDRRRLNPSVTFEIA